MKTQHSPHHWVAVALVLAALLLTLSEAHGQTGTATQEEAARSVQEDDPVLRKEVAPTRDKSLAKEQRSARKATRAVKRSISRSRHGNAPVDALIAAPSPSRTQ